MMSSGSSGSTVRISMPTKASGRTALDAIEMIVSRADQE
jgi:hypothetical protein